MKKFNCSTCKKPIENRGQGIVIWAKYDNNNQPIEPRVVHKGKFGTILCDNKTWDYCYEITDFIKDYPKVKIPTEIK